MDFSRIDGRRQGVQQFSALKRWWQKATLGQATRCRRNVADGAGTREVVDGGVRRSAGCHASSPPSSEQSDEIVVVTDQSTRKSQHQSGSFNSPNDKTLWIGESEKNNDR